MTLVTLVTLTGKSELVSQVVVISPGSVTNVTTTCDTNPVVTSVTSVSHVVSQMSQLFVTLRVSQIL